MFVDSDEGHRYMNGMLHYCQGVLRKCRKLYLVSIPSSEGSKPRPNQKGSKVPVTNILSGRFEALNIHGGEDDESDAEEADNGAEEIIERPEDPARNYSIEKDLIEGDGIMQALMYLSQIEHLFDMVDYHFRCLKSQITSIKKQWKLIDEDGGNAAARDAAIAIATIKTSSLVNLALEEMKYLEESLIAESPQLKTFYHVIAVLVFPKMIRPLEGYTQPKVLESNPHLVIDFVAKEVEFGFKTPANGKFFENDARVDMFTRRAKMCADGKNYATFTSRAVLSVTFLEVGCDFVKKHDCLKEHVRICTEMRDRFSLSGISPSDVSKWFRVFKRSLGGERSVLHTQSLLQCQYHAMPKLSKQVGLKLDVPIIGPKWDEYCNRAEGITDARMDDFFFRIVFQSWFNHVRSPRYEKIFELAFQGMVPRFLPFLSGLIHYVRNIDSPVPFSFTLSVHAMLTGVLCLQGDDDINRIALVSKKASETYYEQIQWLIDNDTTIFTERQLIRMRNDKLISQPAFNDYPEDTKLLSFWNPLIAGSILSQITYLNSVQLGSEMMSLNNQADTVMHLFNALKLRNLVNDNELDFLNLVDIALQDSKAIWGAGKPTTGDFSKHFFVASDIPLDASAKMSDFVKSPPWYMIRDGLEGASEQKHAEINQFMRAQITAENDIRLTRLDILLCFRGMFKRGSRQGERLIQPEDISTSYRYVVQRDFSGSVEDFRHGNSVSALSSAGAASALLNYFDQQEALSGKIVDEAAILSMNYPKLSSILNSCARQLACHMGWDDLIVQCCNGFLSESIGSVQGKKDLVINALIGDHILGELDVESDVSKCKESMKCAEFFKTYFNSFAREEICYM